MQRDEMMKHIEAETQKALDELDDKEPSGTPLGEIEDDHLSDDDVREVMDAFVKADTRAWKREEQDDS
jgi:cytochrome c553